MEIEGVMTGLEGAAGGGGGGIAIFTFLSGECGSASRLRFW